MKFVMTYSCGKDSTLALERMMEMGHEPVVLMVVVSKKVNRSYMHSAKIDILEQYSRSLGIPLLLCEAEAKHDCRAICDCLIKAKEMGAEGVCTGDIDMPEIKSWNEMMATRAGLTAIFPLWQAQRNVLIREILEKGYRCVLTTVDTDILSESFLGKELTPELAEEIKSAGADPCGEFGEYHSMVVDCPIFKVPVELTYGRIMHSGRFAVLDTVLKK